MNAVAPDLSYPMKLALRTVAEAPELPDGWKLARDHDLRSLRALARRGLVEFDVVLDAAYHRVRLTDEGRAVALALYKYKGRAS